MKYSDTEIKTTKDIKLLEEHYNDNYNDYGYHNGYEILIASNHNGYEILIASNPNCPIHILVNFSKSDNKTLAGKAVSNENFPINLLEEFCVRDDEDLRIKIGVICNPNCSESMLQKLFDHEILINSNDERKNVINYYIARNKKCSYDILKIIYKQATSIDENIFLFEKMDSDIYNSDLIKMIVDNPNWQLKEFS